MNTEAKIRILCYGDSNTWGWVPSSMGAKRFDENNRWPALLQKELGTDFEIIEEGLGGRTTAFDDPRPEFPLRNGANSLPAILESHLPLDLVIVMLGTTDTKKMMNLSVKEITNGMQKIIRSIKKFKTLENTQIPKILIVVPPIVKETAKFASKLFIGGTKKSTELIQSYKELSEKEQIHYLDPTSKITVDEIEGVHIDANNHKILSKLILDKVKIFLEPSNTNS